MDHIIFDKKTFNGTVVNWRVTGSLNIFPFFGFKKIQNEGKLRGRRSIHFTADFASIL